MAQLAAVYLGEIIAQEIASVHRIEKVILVLSIKSRKELRLSFNMVEPLKLDKFFTNEICLNTTQHWGKTMSLNVRNNEPFFKSMTSNQNNSYLQWALRDLSTWHELIISSETQIIHVHIMNDKTLPFRLIKEPDFVNENGSHASVINKTKEMSNIIKHHLR